jgi:hypothetical protein
VPAGGLVGLFRLEGISHMATCPRCGGYLSSRHRCRGVGLRRLRTFSIVLLGAAAGFLGPFLIADRPSGPLLLVTALLGAVLTLALHRYARF